LELRHHWIDLCHCRIDLCHRRVELHHWIGLRCHRIGAPPRRIGLHSSCSRRQGERPSREPNGFDDCLASGLGEVR
jgi:hypothetical protein